MMEVVIVDIHKYLILMCAAATRSDPASFWMCTEVKMGFNDGCGCRTSI